jgi:hypothetical protein
MATVMSTSILLGVGGSTDRSIVASATVAIVRRKAHATLDLMPHGVLAERKNRHKELPLAQQEAQAINPHILRPEPSRKEPDLPHRDIGRSIEGRLCQTAPKPDDRTQDTVERF